MGRASKKKKIPADGYREAVKTPSEPHIKAAAHETGSKTVFYLMLIIILFASFAVYFTSLHNGFVYDDNRQVTQNPWIRDVSSLPEIFLKGVWNFEGGRPSNYFRPLMHVIYMLNYHIFGLDPWGFHLVNVVFHAGNSVLVFLLLSRFSTLPPTFPFISALLFAVHPIHTEAVAWVGAIPDLSFAFFYLLSLYFYVRFGATLRKSNYFFSLAFFPLSLLSKEPAATLPVVLVAYDLAFGKTGKQRSAYLKRYIPYFVILGIYFIARSFALGSFAPVKVHSELNIYQYIINAFPLFAQYLWKLLFPINLRAFYVLHPISSLLELKGMLALIVTAAYAASIIVAFKKNRSAFFSLVFIGAPLLPVLYIPALGEASFAERYLYLPSVGFVSLAALLVVRARASFPRGAPALNIVLIILIGLYSAATVIRNTVWKDNITLFADTVTKVPDGATPHNNLGHAYESSGQLDKAIVHYRMAVKLKPDFVDAYTNLGNAYDSAGLTDMAIEQYQTALRLKPDSAETHFNLGVAYEISKGRPDTAIEHYQIALRIKPHFAEPHFGLGRFYLKQGALDMARKEFEAGLSINPDDYRAQQALNSLISR